MSPALKYTHTCLYEYICVVCVCGHARVRVSIRGVICEIEKIEGNARGETTTVVYRVRLPIDFVLSTRFQLIREVLMTNTFTGLRRILLE